MKTAFDKKRKTPLAQPRRDMQAVAAPAAARSSGYRPFYGPLYRQ